MSAFRSYRHDFTLLKAFSGTDDRRVPAAAYIVRAYRRGANSTQDKTIGTGGGETLSVRDIGDIQVGDTVQIGTDSSASRNISAIAASLLTFASGGTGTFHAFPGSRIVPINNRPKTYAFANQFSAETAVTSQVTADANGEGHFYTHQAIIDCIATDGASAFTMIEDQTGQGILAESPFQWNALGDGATDDSAAFRAIIARALTDGVQRIDIPPGVYQLGSTVTIAGASGLTFKATAPGQVVINMSGGSGAMFDLTGACTDVGFEDIFFSSSVSGTTLIQTSTTSSRFFARRCTFQVSSNRTGIVEQGSDARIQDCVFTGSTPVTWIRLNGSQRAQVVGCFGSWSGNASGRIVDIDTGCRGVRLVNCDFKGVSTANSAASGVVGLRNSGAGTAPRDTALIGCHFAAGTTGRGVDIDACQGFQAIGCTMEDCLVGYSIDNATMCRITGGLIVGCQNEGIDYNGGAHIRINGLDISDINQSNTGKSYIDIANGLDDISIVDVTVGTFIRNSGISGAYGVNVTGLASDRIQVLGMRSDGSLGSGMIFNASTSQLADYGHILDSTGNVFHSAFPGKEQDGTPLVGIKFMTGAETTTDVRNIHTLILNQSGNTTWTNMTNGLNGQIIRILNVHATSTAQFANGTNFRLITSPITLDTADTLQLMFSSNLGKWIQIAAAAAVP